MAHCQTVYIGQIFGQYLDECHMWELFSDSGTQIEIGQIRLWRQPTLEWYSRVWTDVTTGLWQRRLVHSHSWILLY